MSELPFDRAPLFRSLKQVSARQDMPFPQRPVVATASMEGPSPRRLPSVIPEALPAIQDYNQSAMPDPAKRDKNGVPYGLRGIYDMPDTPPPMPFSQKFIDLSEELAAERETAKELAAAYRPGGRLYRPFLAFLPGVKQQLAAQSAAHSNKSQALLEAQLRAMESGYRYGAENYRTRTSAYNGGVDAVTAASTRPRFDLTNELAVAEATGAFANALNDPRAGGALRPDEIEKAFRQDAALIDAGQIAAAITKNLSENAENLAGAGETTQLGSEALVESAINITRGQLQNAASPQVNKPLKELVAEGAFSPLIRSATALNPALLESGNRRALRAMIQRSLPKQYLAQIAREASARNMSGAEALIGFANGVIDRYIKNRPEN